MSLLFRTPWKMCKLSLEKLARIGIVKQNRFVGENCKYSFGKLTTQNLIYSKMNLVHNSNVVL